MKRIAALLLCLIMIVGSLSSCGGRIKPLADDKGPIIKAYLTTEVFNLDPAFAFTDEAGIKILGLIYEGLFKIDEDGKVQKALCKSYKTYTNRDGEFVMEFKLNDTDWSDGRSVSANDFVFAWKRILEPEFSSEAASLLFDIKNARTCKLGIDTIDDLGVVAAESDVVQVTFEQEIDVDKFIETLASPALVPLREDKVARLKDWASYYVTMVTNGPFYVKTFEPGFKEMILERSPEYYRNDEETDYLDKYVKPYNISINLTLNAEEQLEAFENGDIHYISELPLLKRPDYVNKVTLQDTLNTHTYYFNTQKAPFDNADVRRALSLAIDREEIANIVTFAKAAEGIIPEGIFNTNRKTSFRKEGGALLESKANIEKARELLKGANVTQKSFSITIRDNEVDNAVAKYIKGIWEELGFTISIVPLKYEKYESFEYAQYKDLFQTAYATGNFDVIAIDAQMLSSDAFSALACFAKPFSGGAVDLTSIKSPDEIKPATHVTGYDNAEYDALIEKAFAEKDMAKRVPYLHQAEEMLMNDMPVMPIFVYQDAYLASKDLSKIGTTYYATRIFTKTNLKNYEHYWETEE